ncbi:carbohydrate ABC transporter permease [Rhodobacteraceae bacterium F11138]|nr:carbohydrate ABC transporter permease [Rhodobacteraceae bacterium F11138]
MTREFAWRWMRFLWLAVGMLFVCFPLYWMAVTALTPRTELFRPPYDVIRFSYSLENIRELLSATQFLTFMGNSLIVALGTVVINVMASTLAGYALSRFEFRGKKTFVAATLWTYMFPPILLAIPLYLVFSYIGLRNSYGGLILAHVSISLPLNVWIMWQYFQVVPRSLEEAAWTSGASRLRALIEVLLPSALPGIISAAIFSFALSWNDFAFAFILQTDIAMFTLPVGLATFVEQSAIHWGLIMASSLIVSLPTFALVFFLQRYLMHGFSIGK